MIWLDRVRAKILHDFFREQLTRARGTLNLGVSAATEIYLVDLLASLTDEAKVQTLTTPLVELLANALHAERAMRANMMRELGDAALMVSGFFVDSVPRRGITVEYVNAIGARAYTSAAQELRNDSTTLSDLAHRFTSFTRLFDEVREQTALCTDGTALRLYERWLQTDSVTLLERLARRGITPSRNDSRDN